MSDNTFVCCARKLDKYEANYGVTIFLKKYISNLKVSFSRHVSVYQFKLKHQLQSLPDNYVHGFLVDIPTYILIISNYFR